MRRITPWILPAAASVAVISVAVIEPRYLSTENLGNVVRQTSPLAVFTLAQMPPLLTRGLDLSQGGVVVVTSVTVALFSKSMGTGPAQVMGLSLGTFTGICCGLAIAYLRVSPLVVTLGVGSILSGLALIFSNGQPVSEVGRGFSDLFYSAQLGIPAPIWIVFVLSLVLAHLLNNRVVGKHIRAVGSNERAAQLSGVPVRKTTVIAYALCGSMTSLGAILLASRISSGHPTVGSDTALQAIAAAVIGGVSLFGGRGSILGALLGALFLGLLSNALNLLNVSSFSQLIAVGVAILAAVIIDRLRIWGRT